MEEVLKEFDKRKEQLADLAKATENLLQTILKVEDISVHSIQVRVKDRAKLKSKYCKPDKDYRGLDDISDLVGLRIITYYSDEIDRIAGIVTREFAPIGSIDDKRLGQPETFGYSALHVDCGYSQRRLESTEYKRFAKAKIEIQITTVIGHAWAEMHHSWYDAENSPTDENRRFHRLAAVLELAEQEFLEIRKKKDDRERIASVRVAAKALEVLLTPESLKAFIEQGNLNDLDNRVGHAIIGPAGTPLMGSLALVAKVANTGGISTIEQLEEKLRVGGDATVEFVTRAKPIWDRARGKTTAKNYTSGISILHLVHLLVGAVGPQNLEALKTKADVRLMVDVDAFAAAAKEVASKFHLEGVQLNSSQDGGNSTA